MPSDMTLRSGLIRLASENPEFRPHLLPLLKESAADKTGSAFLRNALEDVVVSLVAIFEEMDEPLPDLPTLQIEANELVGAARALERGMAGFREDPEMGQVFAKLRAEFVRKLRAGIR